ncbi:hypothetical protein Stsp01_49050 [Streptomyces sp. NBRC 13847]|nr:hypothetical protein Stsp01_49050 [Streptomyces sp. NBRC 13847]
MDHSDHPDRADHPDVPAAPPASGTDRPRITNGETHMSEGTAPAAGDAASVADEAAREQLRYLRGSIDNLDAALVHLLAERFKCTQQVGELKARHHLPPADPAREAAQIERLRRLAEDARLDPAFAEKFLNFIIGEVVRHHRAIADRTQEEAEDRTEPAAG